MVSALLWEFLSNADKRDHRRRQGRSREATREHGNFQKMQDRVGAEEMGCIPRSGAERYFRR